MNLALFWLLAINKKIWPNAANNLNKKNDPIVMAISKALDDPNTSPLSIKNRKSFQEVNVI